MILKGRRTKIRARESCRADASLISSRSLQGTDAATNIAGDDHMAKTSKRRKTTIDGERCAPRD
jgi:hypothetical protein